MFSILSRDNAVGDVKSGSRLSRALTVHPVVLTGAACRFESRSGTIFSGADLDKFLMGSYSAASDVLKFSGPMALRLA